MQKRESFGGKISLKFGGKEGEGGVLVFQDRLLGNFSQALYNTECVALIFQHWTSIESQSSGKKGG
jgi:hypothetical protein